MVSFKEKLQNSRRSLLVKAKSFYHLLQAVSAAVWYRFPARRLRVVGVTGTDGKTTTASLVYEMLREEGRKVGLVTTIAARIGEEEFDTGFHVTSPTPWRLQWYLRRMVSQGVEIAVLEVTSHGLAQHRVWGVDFEVAVLTNVTHEHLDYHRNFEEYVAVKTKLFKGAKWAVLNADDLSFQKFAEAASGKVVTYGLVSAADYQGRNFQQVRKSSGWLQTFTLGGVRYETPLPGRYNLLNILAALAAVRILGVSEGAIRRALKRFRALPGRFEFIDEGQDFLAVVDFAHTPQALREVLTYARSLLYPSKAAITPGVAKSGNKEVDRERSASCAESSSKSTPGVIVVLGCAGLRDSSKRPLMGEIAVALSDLAVFTAEDPRTESVEEIIGQMVAGAKKAGGVEGKDYVRIPDREEAIEFAVQQAGDGDLVLVAGKGHEKSMCFGTEEYPWSDQEVIREKLRNLGGRRSAVRGGKKVPQS